MTKIVGGVHYNEDGLSQSIRAMHLQTQVFGVANENITGFDKVGYQRKDAVISSFAELIGVHALSTVTDDKVGRLMNSSHPLDLALAEKGYFKILQKDGSIKLTRDGRFRLTKDGDLLNLEGGKVLSEDGIAIKFANIPQKLEDIKISQDGMVNVFNYETQKLMPQGKVGVVTTEGATVLEPKIAQGFNEYSNVSLQSEFLNLVPIKRNFEANRQMFVLQNSNLSRAIQQLGSG